MESNYVSPIDIASWNANHLFVVSKELYSLISTVKQIEEISTLDQVLDGLKNYIMKKKLYDPFNPLKIICKEDELGSVFGVNEFTLFDVRRVLKPHIVPLVDPMKNIGSSCTSIYDNAKKSAIEDIAKDILEKEKENMFEPYFGTITSTSAQNASSGSKVNENYSPIFTDDMPKRYSPMFLHIPLTPERYEISDAAESIQGYETAFAKDTSDDSIVWSELNEEELLFRDESEFHLHSESETIIAVEETFDVEYDIDYSTEAAEEDSESETDDEVGMNATFVSLVYKSESDFEFWADESSEDDEFFDAEIPESDQWVCKTCGSFNKPPMMRYCLKCFDERMNWLPEKREDFAKWRNSPRRRKQRTRVEKNSNGQHQECKTNSSSLSESEPHSPVAYHCSQLPGSSQEMPCSSSLSEEAPSSSGLKINKHQSTVDLGLSHPTSASNLSSFPGNASYSKFPFKASNSSNNTHSSSGSAKTSSFASCEEYLFGQAQHFTAPSSQDESCLLSQETDIPFSPKEVSSSFSSSQDTLACSQDKQPSKNLQRKVSDSEKLCIICCSRPAKASIVHGKFAHQVTCYRCARKLQKQRSPCPICRRTIERVVHQLCIV